MKFGSNEINLFLALAGGLKLFPESFMFLMKWQYKRETHPVWFLIDCG